MRFYRFFPAVLAGVGVLAAWADEALENRMLGHVEKILVVDSLNVPRDAFFENYRIAPSTGKILSAEEVARRLKGVKLPPAFEGDPYTGFTNEFEDYMVWAQEDTTGYLRLAESVRLFDGSWSQPAFTPAILNFGEDPGDEEAEVEANAAFPFMLDDGQTLYFAADNEYSLGGFDIFVAAKDPMDGGFLIPGNIGMPFNSPYDDYLLVLDNETGVGWWASDRNQLEDEITIYVYAIPDERVNVDPDDENLMVYASLEGWQDLLDDDALAQVENFRKQIAGIKKSDSKSPDFTLPMPGGNFYHFFSDFKNRKAASMMQSYLRDKEALDKKEKELSSLREEYRKGNRKLADRILTLENDVRNDARELRILLSDIYKTESE